MFREEEGKLDLPKLEHDILGFWFKSGAFQKRRDMNAGKRRWSFMDGPITANNPMWVHHAWGRTYKDVDPEIPSYERLRPKISEWF